ncbi:Cytochrome P450 71A21 [Morus notabilis]|uniref:Cytochrome P450 71A21 n=1 Tax=Morus notabilis TaxID=981085 RepID=W9R0T7_9ROSA|nr:Cytochrome P450 71A21 [Morus notabilis]
MGSSQVFNNLGQLDPFSISIRLLLPLLLLLLLLLLLFGRNKLYGKLNLPPSPPKLPIIGNLHQLGNNPHRSLRSLSNKYGPLMHLNFGQIPTLIVSSPDMVEEIVKAHDVVFSNRPKTTATDILFYGQKNILFSPYGEYWRQARKACVLELLSLKSVHSFQFVREEEVEVLVNNIRKLCLSGNSINLSKLLISASNNTMSRCILGHSYKAEDGSIK